MLNLIKWKSILLCTVIVGESGGKGTKRKKSTALQTSVSFDAQILTSFIRLLSVDDQAAGMAGFTTFPFDLAHAGTFSVVLRIFLSSTSLGIISKLSTKQITICGGLGCGMPEVWVG